MKFTKVLAAMILAGLVVSSMPLVSVLALTQEGQPAKPDVLTIVDFSGKEHRISGWKLSTGTRRLNWLATEEEKKTAKVAAEAGPEVLEFSEGKPPIFKQRVLTLVPLKHLRSIEYDHKKATVTLKIATTNDADLVLQGPTGFVGVNTLSIEAEEDLGEFGKAAVKFLGGVSQGVKSIHFPAPVPLEALPKERPAQISTTDKNNASFTAIGLQPLYRQSDLTLQPSPSLSFQKTVRVELDKIQQLGQVGGNGGIKGGLVFDVKLNSGIQKPLVLVEQRLAAKNKPEVLLGLLGRVEAGYKLVPMATIQQVVFE